MARFLQGYEEKRQIQDKELKIATTIMLQYMGYNHKSSDDYSYKYDEILDVIKDAFNKKIDQEGSTYEVDKLEKALVSKFGNFICDLAIDAYDDNSTISFFDDELGYAQTYDIHGKRSSESGLNAVLGLKPSSFNIDKISAMGDFVNEIQKIIDKNPDFKNLDGVLVLKNINTKIEQDIASRESYDFIEEKISFEVRCKDKEPKEYEIVNSYKEYSLDERDLRETDYEYRVCKLLNNISKDFIENRTYKIISSQDDSGYDNECLLSLDEDEWVNDRQLLTKDATLFLSYFDEDIREHDKWKYSALGIYDGRLYFSKELESKLDNLIEVLSSREDFDEDEFRYNFLEGIDNAVDIAWQTNEIKDEIQYLLKNLNLENEIAIVTRKGKDFEIYPIASPGYTDEINIVPHINKEKIQAVMDGLNDIKNGFFEQELEYAKDKYGLSQKELKKLNELEKNENTSTNKVTKQR